MKQILIFGFLILAGSTFILSCSDVSGNQRPNSSDVEYAIVDIDGTDVLLKVKRDRRGEIIVDDSALKEMKQVVKTTTAGSTTNANRMSDLSQITTMYDGYGNKVETRTFDGDRRLKQVVIRSFINGNTRVFVYGINGEVRSVPEEFQAKLLTASAGEIADTAKIYERFEEPSFKSSDTVIRKTDTVGTDQRGEVQIAARSGDQTNNQVTQPRSAETDRVQTTPSPDQTKVRSVSDETKILKPEK